MKKRIAVIAEYFPPRLGADRRIFELMKRLTQKYDVHFITLPPSYTLFIRKIDSYNKQENQVLCEGIRGHRLGLLKLIWKLWTKSFLSAFAVTLIYLCLQVMKKIAQLKPDIIIINNTSVYTGLLGFVCSKIFNKKLLVEYNDLQALYTIELVGKRINGFLLPTLRRVLVLVEDIIVRHGWKVTAITGFIKNYAFARNTRKDIIVISDGVDTSLFDPAKVNGSEIRFKHGIGNEERLCVYAGRIDECAGAEIILETAKLLKSENNVKFMVVGEGDPQIVNEFSKCDNVLMTGPISKESVPEYLAAADIVLVPFPNSVASHSISPLKLFEALAMEKPVVASAVSGIKEVVCQDFNIMLAPADPKYWASTIMEFIKKYDETKNYGEGSRKIVCEKYDWNRLAEEFSKIIDDHI
jgi:glycosyltransferase involved in cell wall biosynthesis